MLFIRLVPPLLFISIIAINFGFAQTTINSIDGVYIETESEYKPVSEDMIRNGDVIAFDIPGVYDYLVANNQLLRNVVLKIDNIELPEFPAYMLSNESGLIMFKFSFKHLTTEHRQQLYNLKGKATKEVLLGIKLDETNVLTYDQRARIYFSSIEYWGIVGGVLIGAFFLFFIALVLKYKSLIKDDVQGLDVKSASYSFSKSQIAYWTFIVVACFIYIWGFTGDLNSINTTALILLGISAATTSVGTAINKNQEDKAKTQDEKAIKKLGEFRTTKKNFFIDILSDGGGISIHRLQALIFNIVFGIAFVKSVIIDYSMPEFSEVQLVLLGLSNGTYAFIKNSENK